MCGIAGIVMRNGRPPDPRLLDRLAAAIAHRGPDGAGRYVDADTALLHARLSIVDLATGDQPLTGPSGARLVANAEIYNDPELRQGYAGRRFRTRSDCEPILHLYDDLGEGFADPLRGMYALALFDPARRRLLLARDPFGIKPIYYAATPVGLVFASEAQALLKAGLVTADVDARRRAELLQLKFTTGAATIFPGINRVLPGETIMIEGGEIVARRRRAALPGGGPQPIRRDAALRRIESVLFDSVAAHLRSDVPYGLFLSGGIDSAALLHLMARAASLPVQAITVGYPDANGVDESAEALRLAALAGAKCERIELNQERFWREAPRVAAALDDPTADQAALPAFLLGRAAAGRLKVALCGEGGDEMFAGYSRYRRARPPLAWLSRVARSRGVFGADDTAPSALVGWRDGLAGNGHAIAKRSAVQVLQAIDCAEWLPNDLLVKLDRCLMAHGVEGRTPYLDPEVAEFAFRLPDREKVGLTHGKRLLRAWLARAFPAARAQARKKGFKPPLGRWIAARGETVGMLVAATPGVAEVMPAAHVHAVFADAARRGQAAWSLLFYALWHGHHVLGLAADGTVEEALHAAQPPALVRRERVPA
jgi:asparagine synthase (glutamine-hydrolysing)